MKNLIVLRCGDNSLHEKWLSPNAKYDIALSYYGDNCSFDLDQIKFFQAYKGSKWEGLDHFFKSTDFWNDYDAIILPDDDIDTSPEILNHFFDLFHYYKFDLAQPALDHRSYYSWSILLQNKSFKFRETNFVEVMIPCFSRDAFKKLFSTFSENKSGWGLDNLWPKMLGNNAKVGVIDDAPVFHTRPVGSAGNGMGKQKNIKNKFFVKKKAITPHDELANVLKKYDLDQIVTCIKGMTLDNKLIQANDEKFIKLFISGCDQRLLENTIINYGFKNIGLSLK